MSSLDCRWLPPIGPFSACSTTTAAMLLPHYDLGGTGPVLLVLHANSLHGRVYQPLVEQVLTGSFRCISLDLPGHGSCPMPAGQSMTTNFLFDSVYETICHLGLLGCRAFGHSLGGSVFVNVESLHPGTFSAIYVFEPPLMTQRSKQAILDSEKAAGSAPAGLVLASMARRRRWQWPSAEQMLSDLAAKPLFSKWHPQSLQAYVQYGTKPLDSTQPASSDKASVQLSCSPDTEAAVFNAMEPPAAADASKVQCPVAWAVTGSDPGLHSRLPRLGRVCVQEFTQGALREFPSLTHFGPLESPVGVGRDVLHFFAEVTSGAAPSPTTNPCKPDGVATTPRSKL